MATEVYRLKIGGVNGRGNYAENDHLVGVGNVSGDGPWYEANHILDYYIATLLPLLKPLLGSDCHINVMHCLRIADPGGTTAIATIDAVGTGATGSITEGIACAVQLIANGLPKPSHFFQWGMYAGSVLQDIIDSVTYIPAMIAYTTQWTTPTAMANGDQAQLFVHNKALNQYQAVETCNILEKIACFNKRLKPLV